MEPHIAQARDIKIHHPTTRTMVQIHMTKDTVVVATHRIFTPHLHQGNRTSHSHTRLRQATVVTAAVGGLRLTMGPASTACLAGVHLRERLLRAIRMAHHMGKVKDTGVTDLVMDLVARTQEGVVDMADMASHQVIMGTEGMEATEVAVRPKIITHMGTTKMG
jgi:hypothetical protein